LAAVVVVRGVTEVGVEIVVMRVAVEVREIVVMVVVVTVSSGEEWGVECYLLAKFFCLSQVFRRGEGVVDERGGGRGSYTLKVGLEGEEG